MINAATVYVALLDEGVDVWRPVQAEYLGADLYRLTGAPPDDEAWPFAIGDVVRLRGANIRRRRRAGCVREIDLIPTRAWLDSGVHCGRLGILFA